MLRLLRRIERAGWTEESAKQFEAKFGQRLRWLIVLNMERLGLLQSRISPERTETLSNRRLQLYENTLSDLWIELLDTVIDRYVRGVAEGRIHQEPLAYFGGAVRHLVISNARDLGLIRSETPKELVISFCEAKREATRHARLAWIKFALGPRIRQEILSRCPAASFEAVYRSVHHVVDYFFEVFLPIQCKRLADLGAKVVQELVVRFNESVPMEEARGYVGTVTPFAGGEVSTTNVPNDVDEDEYLSVLDRAASGRWR